MHLVSDHGRRINLKMIKTGLSLPYDYLCGRNLSESARLLEQSLGPAAEGLSLLRRQGVECIELGHFQAGADSGDVCSAVRRVWKAGLPSALHPFLPGPEVAGNIGSAYPWLCPLLEELPPFQDTISLTIHAAAANDGSLHDCREQTVAALQGILSSAAEQSLPVRFALELNRAKGKIDPSTTYQGLIEILSRIDDPRLGICWDWGHTQANVLLKVVPPEPPAEFLRQVVHTHVHDLGPDGRTHWPLSMGMVPLEKNLAALREVGFDGCCVLELNPTRFVHRKNVRDAIVQSIARIREVCDGGRNGRGSDNARRLSDDPGQPRQKNVRRTS